MRLVSAVCLGGVIVSPCAADVSVSAAVWGWNADPFSQETTLYDVTGLDTLRYTNNRTWEHDHTTSQNLAVWMKHGFVRSSIRVRHSRMDEFIPLDITNNHAISTAFGDTMCFESPSETGTGTATFKFRASAEAYVHTKGLGSPVPGPQFSSNVSFEVSSGGTTVSETISANLSQYSDDGQSYAERTSTLDQSYSLPVEFTWGEDFPITGEVSSWTSLDADYVLSSHLFNGQYGRIDLRAVFSDTFVWEGLVEVRNSDGELVSDFTLESGSGTDYTIEQVPVPGTLGVLVAGAVLSGARRRRSD